MKKARRASTYLRYEFSNESGKPEGGDIFEFATQAEAEDLITQILKVAESDGVAVNVTIGGEKPFFGFLKSAGLNRADAEKEMVPADLAPVAEGSGGAKPTKAKSPAKKSKAKAKSKPGAKSKK